MSKKKKNDSAVAVAALGDQFLRAFVNKNPALIAPAATARKAYRDRSR
jgi:hypothetical protein